MVKLGLPSLRSCLIMLFIVAFILNSFVPLPILPNIMAICAMVIFIIGFADLKPLNRNMIILLLCGSGFLIWSGPASFHWVQAITENAGIVSLLLTVPMLATILHYAPYEQIILALANKYIQSGYVYYLVILTMTVFLGSLMSVAALPFVYQLMKPLAVKYPAEISHKALIRGFGVNLFWVPNLISVAVVLRYVHISWQELAPVGIGFSLLTFAVACILGKYEPMSGSRLNAPPEDSPGQPPQAVLFSSENRRQILSLLAQVAIILFTVAAFTHYAHTTIFVTVAVTALTVPLVFAVALQKTRIYRQRFRDYLDHTVPGMSSEFILFITIGFFGYALAKSPVIAVLQAQAGALSGLAPGLLSLFIIMVIAASAMVGIHPMIAISSLAISLGKINIGLSDLQLAITFITGYIMYLHLAPFSSAVMIMSGLTGENVYNMGLRINWRYAAVLTVLITVIIQVWSTYL